MNQGLTIVPPPVVGEALRRLEAQGFQVTERSELDDMGNPWPLLRMRLKEAPPAGI